MKINDQDEKVLEDATQMKDESGGEFSGGYNPFGKVEVSKTTQGIFDRTEQVSEQRKTEARRQEGDTSWQQDADRNMRRTSPKGEDDKHRPWVNILKTGLGAKNN
jgi:hypothetical protein